MLEQSLLTSSRSLANTRTVDSTSLVFLSAELTGRYDDSSGGDASLAAQMLHVLGQLCAGWGAQATARWQRCYSRDAGRPRDQVRVYCLSVSMCP